MDAISLTELADIVGGRLIGTQASPEQVRHVTIHSGHIMQGSIFIALPGTQTDGHNFVGEALSNGAVAAVVSESWTDKLNPLHGPLLEVPDTLRALQRLAKWRRSQLRETVIAIVGSSGKTVTKDALVHILGSDRRVSASPGSFNSQIGVPLALLNCPSDRDFIVIEAAATEPGEMAILREMIVPDHVIFTYLGTRHASNFPSFEKYAQELLSIATELANGWLLLGHDSRTVRAVTDDLDPAAIYSMADSDDIPKLAVLESDTTSTIARISLPDGTEDYITVRTPFEEILRDVQLAVAASWLLGLTSHAIIAALYDYVPTATRMEVWQSPAGWTVVRDVATTDAITLGLALRVSRQLAHPSAGRLLVVLADPLRSCGFEVAQGLARTIAASGAGALWMLETKPHQNIADEVRQVAPEIQLNCFPNVESMRPSLLSTISRDDIVLVESPREQSLAHVTSALIEPLAATRLFIDRPALEGNVITFRRLIGPSVQLLAMVKALAYGTDLIEVSKLLQTAGVDQVGVATADEGAAVRRSNVSIPILVTLGTPTEMDKIIRHDLTPVIYSKDMLAAVIDYSHQKHWKQPVNIHLEVDTGMHRTGFSLPDAVKALRYIQTASEINLAGMMTHLACADDPEYDEFTRQQIAMFEKAVSVAKDLGFKQFIRHAANTAGTLRFPEARFDLVRVGIGMYGVYPSVLAEPAVKLQPVVGLVSQIVEVAELTANEIIGYGATYRVPEPGRRVATVAAGYHDCVPRAFSNVGYVAINGRRCPIIGSISMDSMVVDVTDCPSAQVGSDVVIYGTRDVSSVSIERAAAAMGTVPHELLARVGPRVQRVVTNH